MDFINVLKQLSSDLDEGIKANTLAIHSYQILAESLEYQTTAFKKVKKAVNELINYEEKKLNI